ncbi:hypothetical protein GQ44DRAFT_698819 [Phaeosphaeriaceae sp. PMI808]|nr:hypothetical protein GQ44DRAFT_698819 [Phaeosphaeriaceae sp. PMI808]
MYRLLPCAHRLGFFDSLRPSSSYRHFSKGAAHPKMSAKYHLPLKGPIHWVLDWDGTVTEKDTLDALVNVAAAAKPEFPTLGRWKYVVDAYIADYTFTLNELVPGGCLPTTIEGEGKLSKDMKIVEQKSLDRVFESEIFKGLTSRQLDDGAKKAIASGEVAMRHGALDFIRSRSANEASSGDTFHILSVNWSRHFISSCLKAANIEINSSSIFANEFEGLTQGRPSSGQISPEESNKIISSEDKLRYLKQIGSINTARIVYVGDSGTDIECLLAADLGICIRDKPMGSSQKKLSETVERLGVACPHISSWVEADESRIFWSRDFVEIKKLAEYRNIGYRGA